MNGANVTCYFVPRLRSDNVSLHNRHKLVHYLRN